MKIYFPYTWTVKKKFLNKRNVFQKLFDSVISD